MAGSDESEKTEEATQQRRDEFRSRGQVAYTRELASVLALLSMALMLWGMGRFFLLQVTEILRQSLSSFVVDAARKGDFVNAIAFIGQRAFLIVAPLMAILGTMAIASSVVQVGLLNNEEAMDFDLEKINPIAGFQRMFSVRSLVEGVKALLKVVVVSVVVYVLFKDRIQKLPYLLSFQMEQLMAFASDIVLRLLAGVGVFMLVISAADYFFQRWQLEKQMRMSKQEVKEEHKSREGDPMIKARIRRIQRDMAGKRMMKDVPKADVVITNPTHIAVAIQYDPKTMPAPKIVAKGAGVIAEKIKSIAREHNIPVMENKPLARTIYKSLKIGQVIPRELFTAVAQVLSYVYKLKRRMVR